MEEELRNPVKLIVGKRVQWVDENGTDTWAREIVLLEDVVNQRIEEAFGLARTGTSGDEVVLIT